MNRATERTVQCDPTVQDLELSYPNIQNVRTGSYTNLMMMNIKTCTWIQSKKGKKYMKNWTK